MSVTEACDLASRECVPCKGGVSALSASERHALMLLLDGWELVAGHHLCKTYPFDDFTSALDFVNRVGAIAERSGHHPDIQLSWGRVCLEIYTHKINGLTESDFILAAKCDKTIDRSVSLRHQAEDPLVHD